MTKFLRPAFLVLLLVLIWSVFFQSKQAPEGQDDVVLKTDNSIAIGTVVTVEVFNYSQESLNFETQCPNNPLLVEKYENGQWETKTTIAEAENCEEALISIAPKEKYVINYGPWNHELFNELGRYRLSLVVGDEEVGEKMYSTELEVGKRSFPKVIWEEAFYKPIFNTLIFLISKLPGHSLGLAVILLTLFIKLVLLVPNQKALKAQKQMQKVQPQLDALKKKYQNDPQRLAQETMEIWKKHKVSPTSSCLPLLIQFPVLIALFYVVKNGMAFPNPDLLYSGLKGFDTQLTNPHFLGLDLTQVNVIILPILIGGLQFLQMKLSLPKTQPSGDAANPLPMMNKTMLYFMPLLIAFFTASVPAAVGFYWGTSTLFGIGQQLVVNRNK